MKMVQSLEESVLLIKGTYFSGVFASIEKKNFFLREDWELIYDTRKF